MADVAITQGAVAMAKGLNKRKEVKKPKKETAKAPAPGSSANAKVAINTTKPKE
ncbi:MAG: hypothetical protein J0L76_04385 [Rhodobacterales bacterium]|nr:hypothetical protein [Rhodobacterales bacterium]